MPNHSTVFVCRKCSGCKPLLAYLGHHTDATVRLVGCQKICKQPVAGVRIDGSMTWFEGLKGSKRHRALGELLNGPGTGKLPKLLRKAKTTKDSH